MEPLLYLDTNVLLDIACRRRESTLTLLQRIRKERWPCITSRFSVIEMMDAMGIDAWAEKLHGLGFTFSQVQHEFRQLRTGRHKLSGAELRKLYRDLTVRMQPYKEWLAFADMTVEMMDLAENIKSQANIETADALHLATALNAHCNLLVSCDSNFLGLARDFIAAATPDRIDQALKDL